MDYILKASGLAVIFYLFYIVFLKNDTFFSSIRAYFLIAIAAILLIPTIEIPYKVEQISVPFIVTSAQNEVLTSTVIKNNLNWEEFTLLIYFAGVLFFSIRLLIQFASLGNLLSKHKTIKTGKYYFIETAKIIPPFSFFNIIIYNKSQFTDFELEQIINHEKAHANQLHSIDTLLSNLLIILFWFNPFIWLLKKAIQQNLEFEADSYAIKCANNNKLYQLTLLKTCGTTYYKNLVNNFYNSLIKKRIVMLHKNPSKKSNQWKYALLLPILATFVLNFNTKIVAQEKVKIKELNNAKITLIIDKNSTDTSLKQEEETFKKEFEITLSFNGIKRNSNNEITAIKIDAKGKNVKASFENSGTNPINPIKISYNSDENSINIGNISNKQMHYTYTIEDNEEFNGKPHKEKTYVITTTGKDNITWTTDVDIDSTATTVNAKKIIVKSNDAVTWVTKEDSEENIEVEVQEIENGKKKYKIITKSDMPEKVEDNAVLILKKDGDSRSKIHKFKKGENVLFLNTEGEKPIVFIDGKESSQEEMNKLNSNAIEKIEVLKGDNAIKEYGEKAKSGVILITTKKE